MILLSFPRSGNHWVRFILEWFSGQPSLGCKGNPKDLPIYQNIFPNEEKPLSHVDSSSEPICRKVHDILAIDLTPGEQLLLIVRDWRECLIRHNGVDESAYQHWNSLNDFYLKYNGPKLVIYYEDLIQEPYQSIERILRFAGCYQDIKMRDFMDKYEYLSNLSRQGTNRDWKPAVSGKDIDYHKKRATPESLAQITPPTEPNIIEKRYWEF